MAQQRLDPTGQEREDYRLAKINAMFDEIYGVIGGGLTSVTKTATAVGTTTATATLNTRSGTITSAALTTAAAGTYVLTLTDNQIAAGDQVFAQAALGTSTTGTPVVTKTTVTANTAVITVTNIHASAALNGTITVAFQVVKA
jgi:hypothetical protein